jgi:hypothetical protein
MAIDPGLRAEPPGGPRVALGLFLKTCRSVTTLGVRPTMCDYTEAERELLLGAGKVLFPTARFVPVFRAIEKPTFPSFMTYRCGKSRLAQLLLAGCLDAPHPRMRVYYGTAQKARIPDDFSFPVLVMGQDARSARHVARDMEDLRRLASRCNPILVREAVAWDERVRFLCIQGRVLGAQRSPGAPDGALPAFEPEPLDLPCLEEPMAGALAIVHGAGIDDVVIEWGRRGDSWNFLEMAAPPVRWASPEGVLDRRRCICRLIQAGVI